MEFSSRRAADIVIAAPVGRIDHASAEAFRIALEALLADCAEGRDGVVLDFAGVDYISSVGLRVLMMAAKQVRTQKGRIVVAAMQPVVKEIFDISRFNMVYEAFDSVPAALDKLSPAARAAFGA